MNYISNRDFGDEHTPRTIQEKRIHELEIQIDQSFEELRNLIRESPIKGRLGKEISIKPGDDEM